MDWRDRIIEIKRMKVRDIAGHPQNPRRHPKHQADALRGMLDEVGKADVLRAYYKDGKLTLWDGHLRQNLDSDQEWWVAITDLTEQEAALMLVAFDPIAALAEQDAERLDALLRDVQTGDEALQELLYELGENAVALKQTEIQGPGEGYLSKSDKRKQIKPVLYVDEIGDFERAILATGNRNRGEAVLEVCRYYLEHSEKGQLHTQFEGFVAAELNRIHR